MNGVWPAVEAALEWWYSCIGWACLFGAAAAACLPRAAAGGRWARWAVFAAAAAVWLPVDGMPLGRWLHGIDGGLSVPLVAVFFDRIVAAWRGRPLLDRRGRIAAGWFGIVGGFDPYALGWTSPAVMLAAAALAAWLLWRGNGFGVVLLIAGLLWHCDVLESDNAWNYLVDPLFVILAPGVLLEAWLRKPPAR
jgi:hypothetical protein